MPTEEDSDTYPGSTRLKRSAGGTGPVIPESEPQPWEEMGHQYKSGRAVVVLYSIGALASALNRGVSTIRHWDQQNIIPPANIRTDSHSYHARRRIYTHEQISGLQRIAAEEGLLFKRRMWVHRTQFTTRAYKLFADLEIEKELKLQS